MMSTHSDIRVTSNNIPRHGGLTWNRLHSEREEICEKLILADLPEKSEAHLPLDQAVLRAASWKRELLQSRLRKIDDALDRLLSGSYGNCSKCGRWIEDTKLEIDPTIAYCVDCWQRMQH
jgi:RNA polymerase-binding transcription factor DksA